MTTVYSIAAQLNGINGFGVQFSENIYSATLAANTEATITVPQLLPPGMQPATTYNKLVAVFSYEPSKKVYVALNGTAAKPAGGTLASTTSELNPPAKQVKAGDVIHVVTPDTTADVTIALYFIDL